jgi:heme/copper-type cytochrome/quinol oxidase subunit 1
LLVYYCLCSENTHRESAPDVGQLSEVTGREQAIVLIGLIIIAVVLMTLGVSGIQRRHTDNTPDDVGQGAWHCTVRLVYGA